MSTSQPKHSNMPEDDPNLMAILVPLNEFTRNAWKDPHNAPFCKAASAQGFEHRRVLSREPTPVGSDIDPPHRVSEAEYEIRLMLNDLPKDPSKGFMFGRSTYYSDIYCGAYSSASRISNMTFSITIDQECRVVLTYLSPNPHSQISVKYGDQDPGLRKAPGSDTPFPWILFGDCDKDIVVKVDHKLKFKVIVPKHQELAEDHRKACNEYLKNVPRATTSTPDPSPSSNKTTEKPSQMTTPDTAPFYYRQKDKALGSGSYGKVYLVRDASTGTECAGKEFHGDEMNFPECRSLSIQAHDHIVKFIGLTFEDGPLLVMEYVRGGNLARPWRVKDQNMWNPREIAYVLYQCLQALEHLHVEKEIWNEGRKLWEIKPAIIHRDIKPENILVERRYPRPYVKITDFGLATEGSRAGGCLGTLGYAAPEVFSGGIYTSKVDIWSLGIVAMEMLTDGRLPPPQNGVAFGQTWCRELAHYAINNAIVSDYIDLTSLPADQISLYTALWNLIVGAMLPMEPNDRLSATDCLELGRSGAFNFAEQAEQDPIIYRIVPAQDLVDPNEYNRLASQATYNHGVPEAEVWKYQGSKGDATIKPAAIDEAGPSQIRHKPADNPKMKQPRPKPAANGVGPTQLKPEPAADEAGPSQPRRKPADPSRVGQTTRKPADNEAGPSTTVPYPMGIRFQQETGIPKQPSDAPVATGPRRTPSASTATVQGQYPKDATQKPSPLTSEDWADLNRRFANPAANNAPIDRFVINQFAGNFGQLVMKWMKDPRVPYLPTGTDIPILRHESGAEQDEQGEGPHEFRGERGEGGKGKKRE